ncbi:hypothetical protein ACM66Z_05470 [Sulfurovum sp. ST-21]
MMFGPETKFKEKKVFSAEEKQRIMQELNEKRRKEQKSKEAIKRYLSDKKVYRYKGGEYYKVSDYKQSFYITASVIRTLADTVQEVELERSGYTANRTQKGFIKWDCIRECILISPDRVKVYYKPFYVEKIR